MLLWRKKLDPFTLYIHKTFGCNDCALQYAYQYFQRALFDRPFKGSAIFDIDDTIRNSNNGQLVSPYILLLAQLFKSHGITIHLVTARPQSLINDLLTRNQLLNLKFTFHESIHYLPPGTDIGAFKAGMRKHFQPIVFSVGDQWTDITEFMPNIDESKAYWIQHPEYWAIKLIS